MVVHPARAVHGLDRLVELKRARRAARRMPPRQTVKPNTYFHDASFPPAVTKMRCCRSPQGWELSHPRSTAEATHLGIQLVEHRADPFREIHWRCIQTHRRIHIPRKTVKMPPF